MPIVYITVADFHFPTSHSMYAMEGHMAQSIKILGEDSDDNPRFAGRSPRCQRPGSSEEHVVDHRKEFASTDVARAWEPIVVAQSRFPNGWRYYERPCRYRFGRRESILSAEQGWKMTSPWGQAHCCRTLLLVSTERQCSAKATWLMKAAVPGVTPAIKLCGSRSS